MGLAADTILHLINLRRAGRLPDRARVVEIGAQQLSNSFNSQFGPEATPSASRGARRIRIREVGWSPLAFGVSALRFQQRLVLCLPPIDLVLSSCAVCFTVSVSAVNGPVDIGAELPR